MKKIRIIAIPPGFAPLDIREEWVGVLIEVNEKGVEAALRKAGKWSGNSNEDGYVVLAEDAINALEAAGRNRAVRFWRTFPGTAYQFKREVCEEVA